MELPVIDFSQYGLEVKDPALTANEGLEDLAAQVKQALCSIGFMYIKHHGISQKQIDDVFHVYCNFFVLPEEVKQQYSVDQSYAGWIACGREQVDPAHTKDIKECYNIRFVTSSEGQPEKLWPDVVDFKEKTVSFYESCSLLSKRVLEVMALALNLQDREFFLRHHKNMGQNNNYTTLRTTWYPPVAQDTADEQLRLGVHTDYGTITLLFQDDVGGLEVLPANHDKWIPLPPIPGTIVINIGDIMQRWTADKFPSTQHRVVVPKHKEKRQMVRQSISFFGHCDDSTIITPCDGSERYPPVTCKDFIDSRLKATYEY